MEETQKLKDLEIRVSSFPERATFITVHSQSTLNRANDFLKEILGWEKEVDAFCDPNINRLHKAHKESLAQKATFKKPLGKAKETVREEIKKYLVEQDNIRKEAEDKAKQEAEKRFEEARELEKAGEKEKAEEIRKDETSLATSLPPPVKADGTHLRKHWTFEIEDENKIPREYMEPNKLKISETVRLLKGKTRIPGVKIFQESTIATRIK